MKNSSLVSCLVVPLLLSACAGIKVVNPNDQNKNEGTMALDTSGGGLKLVGTYTCKLDSMGKHFQGLGKTESEALNEALAKCRDNAVLSFCKAEKATCVKN